MNKKISKPGNRARFAIKLFIYDFIGEHGYSPSIREISDGTNRAIPVVHHHLEKMKENGDITWNPKLSRTIRILRFDDVSLYREISDYVDVDEGARESMGELLEKIDAGEEIVADVA